MPTFTATKAGSTKLSRANVAETTEYSSYTLTAPLLLNDVLEMVKIPSGATITNVILASDDIDTNGTPLVSLDVGDGSSAGRFITGSTIGRTGGVAQLSVQTGLLYQYTVDDTIDIKCTAAPATGVVGTLRLAVTYTMAQ